MGLIFMREYALSLGRDIPESHLKAIDSMTSKVVVKRYCRRFPLAEKPKVAPKKAAPKPVKVKEEEE